jgi:ubiquinone/menaquinone biosynthesis C-methylase UbiE
MMGGENYKKEGWPSFVSLSEKVSTRLDTGGERRAAYRKKFGFTKDEAETIVLYEDDLDLDPFELKGKKVMDVGSGPGELKSGLIKMGFAAKDITALDHSILDSRTLDSYGKKIYKQKQVLDVQGKAEDLPIRDESFDFVLAYCSVPIMAASDDRFDLIPYILDEMVRIAKRGGIIKVSPVGISRSYWDHDMHNRNLKMTKTIANELDVIHKEYPGSRIKITKVFSGADRRDFSYMLEITK